MDIRCLLCQRAIEKLENVRHCTHCGIITCDSSNCGKSYKAGQFETWTCDNCLTLPLQPADKEK